MKLASRLLTIFGKSIRLMVLLTLIRCFGPDAAACMLAALRSWHRWMAERFLHRLAK